MLWILFSSAMFILFIILWFNFLKKLKRLKTNFKHPVHAMPCEENTLVDERHFAGNFNQVYENHRDSKTVIDKYMISHENGTPFLICHVCAPLKSLNILEITGCDANGKAIHTLYVRNIDAFSKSPVIKLPRQVRNVNISIHEDEDQVFDSKSFYDDKEKAYLRLAKYESVIMFLLFPPLGYFLLNLLVRYDPNSYMNVETLSFGFVMIVLTCVINYALIALWIRKQSRIGGEMNG
ncbi:MAG: hypothetical protein ACOCU0_03770 [Bacillota bacterium]